MPTLAFIPAQPFPWTRRGNLRGHHSRTPIIRRSHYHTIRSCQRNPATPSETPTTLTADREKADPETPIKEPRKALMFDPNVAPSLLRKPESVIAIVTLGFLSTIAFLARSAHRITTDVATRANYVITTRKLEARLRARVRERKFLKSAVEATCITLESTSSFLGAQRRRVSIAEETLHRLESQRHDLQQTEQRRNELVEQVAAAERDLTAERRMTVCDEQTLRQMQDTVTNYRNDLTTFEQNLEKANVQLLLEQQTGRNELYAAREKIETLESELTKADRVLNDALEMKERLDSTCRDAERRAETFDATVKTTLSEVEDHRRKIDSMTQRAESVKRDVERTREDGLSARDHPPPNDHIESVITDINSQKKGVELSLSELDTRKIDLTREQNDLLDQLSAKDENLRVLREKLSNLQKVAMPDEVRDKLTPRAVEDALPTDEDVHAGDKVKSPMTDTHTLYSGEDSHRADLQIKHTKPQLNTLSPATPREDAIPPSKLKITSGSRKSVESTDQTQTNQDRAKPRRGRPRKTIDSMDAGNDDMNKGTNARRKRGRPRKKSSVQPLSQ